MDTSRRLFLAGLGSTAGVVGLSGLWTPTLAQAAPSTDIITTHVGAELRRLLARQQRPDVTVDEQGQRIISDLNEGAANARLLAMHGLLAAAQPELAAMDGGVVDAFQNWELLRSGMQQGMGYTGSAASVQQFAYDSRASVDSFWYDAVINASRISASNTMRSTASLSNQIWRMRWDRDNLSSVEPPYTVMGAPGPMGSSGSSPSSVSRWCSRVQSPLPVLEGSSWRG